MIKRYHFSLDAWNLRTTRIDYSLAIDEFLRYMGKLMGNKIINGPTVIYRKEGYSGLTGSILTDLAHIIIHTSSEPKELTVNICSYKDFSMDEVGACRIKRAMSCSNSTFCLLLKFSSCNN